MHYMLLIYTDETAWTRMSEDERRSVMREHFELTDDLRAAGAHVHSAPLQPSAAGASVRVRDGHRVVTDGPFAETKEQLGGYYLIEAESLDDAVEWAARIPSARWGRVEVRPLMEVPDREAVRT